MGSLFMFGKCAAGAGQGASAFLCPAPAPSPSSRFGLPMKSKNDFTVRPSNACRGWSRRFRFSFLNLFSFFFVKESAKWYRNQGKVSKIEYIIEALCQGRCYNNSFGKADASILPVKVLLDIATWIRISTRVTFKSYWRK